VTFVRFLSTVNSAVINKVIIYYIQYIQMVSLLNDFARVLSVHYCSDNICHILCTCIYSMHLLWSKLKYLLDKDVNWNFIFQAKQMNLELQTCVYDGKLYKKLCQKADIMLQFNCDGARF